MSSNTQKRFRTKLGSRGKTEARKKGGFIPKLSQYKSTTRRSKRYSRVMTHKVVPKNKSLSSKPSLKQI